MINQNPKISVVMFTVIIIIFCFSYSLNISPVVTGGKNLNDSCNHDQQQHNKMNDYSIMTRSFIISNFLHIISNKTIKINYLANLSEINDMKLQ